MTRRISAALAVLGLFVLCFLAFAAPAEGSGYGLGLAIPGWLCEYGGGVVLEDGPGLICAGGRFDGWEVAPLAREWGGPGFGGLPTAERTAAAVHAAVAACHADLRAAHAWAWARARCCGPQAMTVLRRAVGTVLPRPLAAAASLGPCPLPMALPPLAA
ncbi:hypothetical protein [Streptomyces hoynatensis]|uniref:Uncharacterized protein n=1 Tax=Streptomyces hoynatensis TaxID=1141874 RepID=A0A3A9YKN2_9ACTN|nr:hypothetical protein [Streptomyces hoynatensis]RKN37168.1 hypothetical protein D7294_28510 [Streptomyces hoynatensis]